ncbi:hypothetical protein CLV63_12439 [Murinocardiopsis flavida]|uniref:MinD-like ATPase involved in chromosome partitioning or flagellar assembly n=1 Tax=Murinocardiopsis flavida TaxID=645275 RepID=A0A2P8CY99_9ACTN|nr:hypothetical protein [Murinocardiopsis flavida]PSK89935.1 hypothetical protein CLV63_12439 [Murinocardiopsis flavida]
MAATTIAVFSLGGAPGVTTLSLALAATWPAQGSTVLVEADSSGGAIAAWRRMPTSPGLVDLAAAARTGSAFAPEQDETLLRCTQTLPGGQRVCVAPATADRAGGAVTLIAQHPAVLASASGPVVVVDVGRMTPRSAAAHLAAAADVAVLVVGDDLAQLKRAKEVAPALRAGLRRFGVVVAGNGNGDWQIAEAIAAPVWARLPQDVRAAAFLSGSGAASQLRRRPLMAAARRLGHTIAEGVAPEPVAVSTP